MEFLGNSNSEDVEKQIHINDINIDLILEIIDYLDVENLLLTAVVQIQWNDIINNRNSCSMWKKFSIKVYNGRYNSPLQSTLLERIKLLPLLDLKRQLARVDTSGCLEKKEYYNMMTAHLLFKGVYGHYTRCTVYPTWSLKMDSFKATYFHALKDHKRTTIFKSELCKIKWSFHFKEHEFEDADLSVNSWKSIFREDYTMMSMLHQQEMSWQFVDTQQSGMCVQVENYPPLIISRAFDGSFRMENHYVFFLQTEPLELLPLF